MHLFDSMCEWLLLGSKYSSSYPGELINSHVFFYSQWQISVDKSAILKYVRCNPINWDRSRFCEPGSLYNLGDLFKTMNTESDTKTNIYLE